MTAHATITIDSSTLAALQKWYDDRARLEPQGTYPDAPREALPLLRMLAALRSAP